jgi:hypothetical protein
MENETPEQIAARRLEFIQKEYWRLRNGKARFMRCPYCTSDARMKNWPDAQKICCPMFAKAFRAILDRQEAIDKAWAAAQFEKAVMDTTVN